MHNLHQTLEENINCIKALSIQGALEQLEHMTEVVFVSQSVKANYHSFHSSSRSDKHLAEFIHRTGPSGEFRTCLSLGKPCQTALEGETDALNDPVLCGCVCGGGACRHSHEIPKTEETKSATSKHS